MDIIVTFRHTEPIESLKTYAEEKVSKLKKYLDFPTEAHIVLSVEKFRHQADVTLTLDGTRIKGVEETGDMYSAIDQVMDKIEKQVKRHLSKIRDHRSENQRGEDKSISEEAEAYEAAESDQKELVIEIEKMVAKPMDPEEAAMQLNLLRKDFLVFRNAKSREINVIYKRGDDMLGLIEPQG
jgi:putative sigma-54 modulation protein